MVVDFCELLQSLGFKPWLAPFHPNGKPQHVIGQLGAFKQSARKHAEALKKIADCGVSLVGVDPSMTLSFRSEYVRALGKDAVPQVLLPQEWLAQRLGELPQRDGHAERLSMTLLLHCTERTNAPDAVTDWIKVGKHFGIDTVIPASGCCGMADLYGHETSNRQTSEDIYGLSWKGILANSAKRSHLAATGYSCRSQTKIMHSEVLKHPTQIMLAAVRR